VNKHLEGKEYLVGSELTIADIALLNAIYTYLTFFAGKKELKGLANVVAWVERLAATPSFKKWYGKTRFVDNAMTWFKTEACEAAPKKKQEKKAKKPAAPVQPKKPKYEFPDTDFDLFNFKTFFVNEKDTEKAMAEFWEKFDPKGWTLYHLKYIKYPGECEEVYRTKNLLNGFLSRVQHISKHLFGVHTIAGDEPNLVIEAVWLVQGNEIFPDLKEHDQFETYTWTPLDHTKAEDKCLAEQFLKAREEDVDKVNGHTMRIFKWVK